MSTRAQLVLALIGVVVLAYLLMRSGMRRRIASQAAIAVPAPLVGATPVAGPWEGKYLGATHAGRWLDRIDAHELGQRSLVQVTRTRDGVDVRREGARSFSIPAADLVAVRADKAIAGRAYEDGGIVVLTFRLGETPVDIGFRFPSTEDHIAALAALATPTEVTP